ncbi:MAG: DUF2752 domain-containing protein [Clostridium celatum]|nr:DUF2752 domain-containing protein [Clostridium celatum]MDU2123121.1 DUF2752 domain-containing protein [Clostridium celatum]MDU4980432.1 DUF2752 domain-containing protein [Clostridium celatum]
MNKYFKSINKNIKFGKILILVLLGLSIIFLFIKKFAKITGSICLIRGLTGVPCPSCGMSRAIIAFINGDIINAFKFHPLFWLPFILFVLIVFRRKFFKQIIIGAIILTMIVYIFRMAMFFPNIDPMKYNEKSILNQIIENKKK